MIGRRLLRTDAAPLERAGEPTAGPVAPIDAFVSGYAETGRRITEDRALSLSAVWACVRVISDTIGSLPLMVYQRQKAGGRSRAWWTNQYRLLHDAPNPESTAADVWAQIAAHLNLHGNAYLGKERDRAGRIVALWPVPPQRMRVARDRGRKVFLLRDEATMAETRFPSEDVIHIRGLSLDGMMGLSPLAYHLHTIGGGLAKTEYAHRFFANSAIPRVVLTTPDRPDESEARATVRRFESIFKGLRNSHRTALLPGGIDIKEISLNADDAQMVEASKLTVQEIARIFRVPPSMIAGDSGGSLTYSTVEGDAIHFVTHTIRPWLVRVESALTADPELFPDGTLFSEFLVDALLRADTKSRFEAYRIATNGAPWMDWQEVRQAENLEPRDIPQPSPSPATTVTGGAG